MSKSVVNSEDDLNYLKGHVVNWSCDVGKQCYTLPLVGFLTTYGLLWRGEIKWLGREHPEIVILSIKEIGPGVAAREKSRSDSATCDDYATYSCQMISVWLLYDREGFGNFEGAVKTVIKNAVLNSGDTFIVKCIPVGTWNSLLQLFDWKLSLRGLAPIAFLTRLEKEADLRECPFPEEYYLKKLSLADAVFACKYWKFNADKTRNSSARFQGSAMAGLGLGAFTKNDNELVAWCFVLEEGCIGALHTVDSHRRRGLASALVCQLSKQMIASGLRPFAFIENISASVFRERLFEKIGFTVVKSNLVQFGPCQMQP